MEIRITALEWFRKMTLEDQFYITIKHNNLIVGDHTRHPDSLTSREIELIYKTETNSIKSDTQK